ncbi:hypothetical protein SFRURICE_003894 [Spodoptera frugiperda]|nr:hypothetical protein SFRURICE_003894 [Spodoptera frugiperda]
MSHCIVEKLTPILKYKWYDYAANRKLKDTPVLKLLSMFLNEEADKCGAYALPERDRDSAIDERRRRRVERTFMVNTRQKTSSEQCPACKQHRHKLPDCRKYKQLDIDKRWDIAKSNNMCFRCLRSKHRRNMCKAPVCDVKECNMKHHKLLHKERNVNTAAPAPPAMTTHETVTSARETTSRHNRRAYLKIVPVTLSGPHASIHTYALLDDGSTVTLLDASAADILGADGPESPMCIQGLGTEFKHERSRTVSLHIQGKYHSAPQKIEAARTVTRLEVTAQTSRRLPDVNFRKKKQQAPTVLKSHLGTIERLDKNEQRAKESRVIAATQDNRATPCDSSLSVLSTSSAGAGTSRLRGKIKAPQKVNKVIINPLVSARKSKYKKLHSSLRDDGNATCPYPRLNHYGPILVDVDRLKRKRTLFTSVMCKDSYRCRRFGEDGNVSACRAFETGGNPRQQHITQGWRRRRDLRPRHSM